MRIKCGFLSLVLIACFVDAGAVACQSSDTEREQVNPAAQRIVDAFVAALKKHNVDAMMECVTIPWSDRGGIYRSKEKLRESFHGRFRKDDLSKLDSELLEVRTYKEMREKFKFDPKIIEQFDVVADDDDLFFHFKWRLGDDEADIVLIVHLEGEKARLVGFR
ncbi:MAG: hypothetical protein RIC55_28845 [Pirellulaceae bacterium]